MKLRFNMCKKWKHEQVELAPNIIKYSLGAIFNNIFNWLKHMLQCSRFDLKNSYYAIKLE